MENQSKFCECGCGQLTPLRTYNQPKRGFHKDEPLRFINGHNGRGKPPWRKNPPKQTKFSNSWPKPLKNGKLFAAKPIEVRFWEKVDKRGEDECWPWLGMCQDDGYGVLVWRKDGKKYKMASHVSFELANGRPTLDCVLHSCDNPPCVNPKHLFEGTRKQNIHDMIKKGRAAWQSGREEWLNSMRCR